jgi:hypothetical protein
MKFDAEGPGAEPAAAPKEDPRLLTGAGRFVDDVRFDNMLYLGTVRLLAVCTREDPRHPQGRGPADPRRDRGRRARRLSRTGPPAIRN